MAGFRRDWGYTPVIEILDFEDARNPDAMTHAYATRDNTIAAAWLRDAKTRRVLKRLVIDADEEIDGTDKNELERLAVKAESR